MEQKKIAVCISGAFRGNYKIVLDNIYTNLINPLNADVFISTWDNHDVFPGYQRTGSPLIYRTLGKHIELHTPEILKREEFFRQVFPKTYSKLCNPIISKLDAEDILNHYKVTELSIVSENAFHNLIQPKLDVSGWWNLNQYKMFYLMYKVNELMHLYEQSSNIKYDIVIRVRPDIVFEEVPNIIGYNDIKDNEILMRWIYWGLDDSFFVAMPSAMDKLLSLWSTVLKTKKLSPFKNHKYRAHPLITAWTCCKNIEVIHYNYNLTVQKVLDDYLPNFSNKIKEDLQTLEKKKCDDYESIKLWVQLIEKKFNLQLL